MNGGAGLKAAALAALAALLMSGCLGGHPVEMFHGAGPSSTPGFLAVRADLPSGKLEVSAGSAEALYDLSLSYCRDHFRPLTRFQEDASRSGLPGAGLLEIAALSSREDRGEATGEEPNLMTLLLRPGVPLDLRLSVGRGSMDLDLTALGIARLAVHGGSGPAAVKFEAGNSRDLEQFRFVAGEGPVRLEGLGWGRVTSLEFHGGAGEATIDWTGPGPAEAAAFLDPGTGPISLSFPADLGVVLTGKGLPPGAGFEGFVEQGGVWVSENKGKTSRRLTLVLDPGAGEIRFAWKP